MSKELEKRCAELAERSAKAFGSGLVSLILYGSGARGDQDESSDLNVLCVLEELTPKELGQAEPIFKWWRGLNNPAPLLLSAEEVKTSTDCFAMEFHDIQEVHRILAGANVVADLVIDDSFYRGLVEFEERSKQLRLRQKAAGVLSDDEIDDGECFDVFVAGSACFAAGGGRSADAEAGDCGGDGKSFPNRGWSVLYFVGSP